MVITHQKFDLHQKCLIEKVVIQAPFRFVADFQDEACFIHFVEGTTKINSESGQHEIAQGESVLLKCGTYLADLLKYSKADTYEILVFHLPKDLLKTLYQNELPGFIKPSNQTEAISHVATSVVIKKFIENLYFYFDHPELISTELLELKVKELVLLLVQSHFSGSVVGLFSELFTPRTLNVREVVNAHLFSQLSVEDLARLAHLSVSTFNRTFQNIFHTTPANYIKARRLERAKELLSISTLTVSEIAFQTCFNDAAHFSRSFKQVYDCSPTEYRLTQRR